MLCTILVLFASACGLVLEKERGFVLCQIAYQEANNNTT